MKAPRSLRARLAVSLGVLLACLWVAAAVSTAILLRDKVNEIFDAEMQETAQRLLPLAVVDIVGRESVGVSQRLATARDHQDSFSFIVRDDEGRILLQSFEADPAIFPPWQGPGFAETESHRFYSEAALQGTIRITVGEPLAGRRAIIRQIEIGLGLPLLIVVPVALLFIIIAVRTSLAPLRRFRARLEARSARDMSPVPAEDIPTEIAPVAATLNALLERLRRAFEAERSFAANAAHELRTPLAGAIAQAQRLQAETGDSAAAARAAEIEATLKRLTTLSERLMQIARAEGARLRRDESSDLRPVARIVIDDIARMNAPGRIRLTLPEEPVLSNLDPDAFGILCRNLVENALVHGSDSEPVAVSLKADRTFCVANAGPVVPAEVLARLTARFERAGTDRDGSGLGLAIVAAIADRTGGRLELRSPRSGQPAGFEACLQLPLAGEGETRPAGG